MKARRIWLSAATMLLGATSAALAQTATVPPTQPPKPAASQSAAPSGVQAPTSLTIYFDPGSYAIRHQDVATLDKASRVFNDGNPIVMIVTGMADATGLPGPNLLLSQKRADVVFEDLIARGLPPNRFQILAKGASDSLNRNGQPDVANPQFRKVEITWR